MKCMLSETVPTKRFMCVYDWYIHGYYVFSEYVLLSILVICSYLGYLVRTQPKLRIFQTAS